MDTRDIHPLSSAPRCANREKDSETSRRRRRIPEFITRNACLNCRKARAKCDGKTPCKRCATRIETRKCIYDIHIRHAKEELIQQITQLKAKDHLTKRILQALSTDKEVPEILNRLKNRETYESIVEWLGTSPLEDLETLPSRDFQYSASKDSAHRMGDSNIDNFRWTSVTTHPNVLAHLLQLYFAWTHPVHTLFSETHFVESYKRPVGRYCSSVLTNAICAMACHLHVGAEADEVDFTQLGEGFSDEPDYTLRHHQS